jgi:hypothetical protein
MPTTACRRRSGLNYVSRRDVLEHLLLQREIGHKATQPSVLALQLLQAFGVLKLQAPILPAPAIMSCLRFLWTPYCPEKLEDEQRGR